MRILATELFEHHVLLAQSASSDAVAGSIRLFDRASGRELWERDVPTSLVGAQFRCDERSLFVATDAYAFSLDLETGDERWVRGPFDGPIRDFALTDAGAVAAFQGDGTVLMSRSAGTVLWAFDADESEPLHIVDTLRGAFVVLRRVEQDSSAIRMDVLPLQESEAAWSEVLQQADRVSRVGEWVVIERGAEGSALPSRAVRIQRDEPERTESLTEHTTLADGQSLMIRTGRGRLLRLRRLVAFDFGETDAAWQRAWPQSGARLHLLPQPSGLLAWPQNGQRAELLNNRGEAIAEWRLEEPDRSCTPVRADEAALLVVCSGGRGVRLVPAERR